MDHNSNVNQATVPTAQAHIAPQVDTVPVSNASAPAGSDRSGLAITALVLGILSLCAWLLPVCGGPVSIIGLVLGVISIKSAKKTMAIIGIVLCSIALVLTIANAVMGAMMATSGYIPQLDMLREGSPTEVNAPNRYDE